MYSCCMLAVINIYKMCFKIHHLEKKIAALIAYCKDLENQNSFLESEQTKLKKERATLVEKNRAAKTKIELMIEQLKSLGDS